MNRILISIVDDDQLFRESMRKLVTLLGYTVEEFPSAADFLEWGLPVVIETRFRSLSSIFSSFEIFVPSAT